MWRYAIFRSTEGKNRWDYAGRIAIGNHRKPEEMIDSLLYYYDRSYKSN